jgi:beta-glucanase (GH16 family)
MRKSRPTKAALAALALAASGAATAQWHLVREFDFARAATLDPQAWSFETGFIRNREAQYYRRENVSLHAEGFLRIEARKDAVPNAAWRQGSREWRSSRRASTYTSGAIVLNEPILYGRIEVRARSTGGQGVWPAIWLLSDTPGEYGEIDLYEYVGKHPGTVFAAVHWGRTAGTRLYRSGNVALPGFEGTWRTHVLEWTPERIEMWVDGHRVMAFDPREAVRGPFDPLRRPMRLHLNLALGGSWGGDVDERALPARFDIERIRILRREDATARKAESSESGEAGAPVRTAPLEAAPAAMETETPEAPERPDAPMRWGR